MKTISLRMLAATQAFAVAPPNVICTFKPGAGAFPALR
jgi:hypothetical protein